MSLHRATDIGGGFEARQQHGLPISHSGFDVRP
jgi:hypothetical protein